VPRACCPCTRQRVVHRNIKPSNLLINRRGQVSLADDSMAVVAPSFLLSLASQSTALAQCDAAVGEQSFSAWPSVQLFLPMLQVKIADFGVSKELASTMAHCNSYVGTSDHIYHPERINPRRQAAATTATRPTSGASASPSWSWPLAAFPTSRLDRQPTG